MTTATPHTPAADGTDADELTPAELDDLAAEPDTCDPEAAADGDTTAADCPVYYSGDCYGGPYDMLRVTSRYPRGFLLVDKPDRICWIYDYADGRFTCRDPQGAGDRREPLAWPLDDVRRWQAADSDSWDVRAYDHTFDGDDDQPAGGAA